MTYTLIASAMIFGDLYEACVETYENLELAQNKMRNWFVFERKTLGYRRFDHIQKR